VDLQHYSKKPPFFKWIRALSYGLEGALGWGSRV